MLVCSKKFLQIFIGVSCAFTLFLLAVSVSRHPTIRVGDFLDLEAIVTSAGLSASAAASQPGASSGSGSGAEPSKESHVRKVLQVGTTLTAGGTASKDGDRDFLVGDIYVPGFSISNPDLCHPRHNSSMKLLILITTAPDNQVKRKAIRETWGHFALMNDVRISFLVGKSGEKQQQYINDEDKTYGDIIQANFIDHYDNLTLKTTAMLEWIRDHCSEVPFVLKTDDDMYVNIPRLLKFIDSHQSDKNTIYGRLAQKWQPVRNKQSKYYVSRSTYSGTHYPDFCTGPAYLFTTDVVSKLFNETLTTKYMKLEDVVVTGIAAQNQKVHLVNVPEIKNTSPSRAPTACMLEQAITFHDIQPDRLYQFWASVRTKAINCGS